MTACPSHRKKSFLLLETACQYSLSVELSNTVCSVHPALADMRHPQGIRLLTTYLTSAVYSQSMSE